MMSDAELSAIRSSYARHVLFSVGVANAAIEDAFAHVAREQFLGAPPWRVFNGTAYCETPDTQSDWPYWDVVIALLPERRINNGQPSAHALWIDAANVHSGDDVVHIGAGGGYYSAILARLAGPTGRVRAFEYVPELAGRAAANLAGMTHVEVVSGPAQEFDPADVIYVNAGATRPQDQWLDRLKPGGRLVMPLTRDEGRTPGTTTALPGAMFCFTRDEIGFAARFVSPAAFIPGEAMRDTQSEAALAKALQSGRVREVRRLYRGEAAAALAPERCWLKARGWALAFE